ncbi:endonuclease/exonuclease/phosphatase family protein [Sphingobacteriaceae bacterium WQ 2009]|uniref:Endonuclease/exonuclease/phosphatase family protein n=2 Tax=Rhinopithecimicrobium faecis TaxID=2820698 RepID=A0A8T4HDC6_9SPHI|nr:endonuclease/exonuclease/phosphatase family protein [Sphingobacteriaceae bacterium WQ 2009]
MITLLFILAILFIVMSFIPLIRNDYWTFRIFEYPRMQKLIVCILLLISLIIWADQTIFYYSVVVGLAITILYLLYQIFPFTPLARKHVLKVQKNDPKNSLSIFVSNVFEDNTNYAGCLAEIKKTDADIVLLLETNERWAEALKELDTLYPEQVKEPLNNTYGMLFFSKLPLKNSEVKYLVEDDIPSIHTQVMLPSGQLVQIYALHPTPPVPNENPRSTERDKELLLVADLAKDHRYPVIVCGDMNDVAWSYTTELFLKMSKLLDPRRGRGFINTFHAHYPLMRFPLDHIFVSDDFKLKHFQRKHNFDSDHFPIYTELQYEARASKEQEGLVASEEDKEMAEHKKNKS